MADSKTAPPAAAGSSQEQKRSGDDGKKGTDKAVAKKTKVSSVDAIRQPTAATFEDRATGAENKDGKQRRYVRNDPIRVDQVRQLGYDFAKDADGEKITVRNMVLMEIPQEDYQERVREKNRRTQSMTTAGHAQFKQRAAASGAETADKSTVRTGKASDADDE